jgi:hypothetical protein
MTLAPRLDSECIVQRDPDIIAAEAEKDIVMVNINSGFYYGVSDVSRYIWEAIEHPKKISDLIDDLAANYNIDRATCEQQTLSYLEELRQEQLLQVLNASSN